MKIPTTLLLLVGAVAFVSGAVSPFDENGKVRLGGFCMTEDEVNEHNAGGHSFQVQYHHCAEGTLCVNKKCQNILRSAPSRSLIRRPLLPMSRHLPYSVESDEEDDEPVIEPEVFLPEFGQSDELTSSEEGDEWESIQARPYPIPIVGQDKSSWTPIPFRKPERKPYAEPLMVKKLFSVLGEDKSTWSPFESDELLDDFFEQPSIFKVQPYVFQARAGTRQIVGQDRNSWSPYPITENQSPLAFWNRPTIIPQFPTIPSHKVLIVGQDKSTWSPYPNNEPFDEFFGRPYPRLPRPQPYVFQARAGTGPIVGQDKSSWSPFRITKDLPPLKTWNKPTIIPQFPAIPSHKVQIVGQDKSSWSPYSTQTFDLPVETSDSDSSEVDETDISLALQADEQPKIFQGPLIVPQFPTIPMNQILGQDKSTWSPYPNNQPYDEFFGRPDLHILKPQPYVFQAQAGTGQTVGLDKSSSSPFRLTKDLPPLKTWNKPTIIPQFPEIPSHEVHIVGQDKSAWSPRTAQTFDLAVEPSDSDLDVDETDTSLALQADGQPKIFNKPVIIPQLPTIPSHEVHIVGQDKNTWSPYATQTFDLPVESSDSDSDVDETDTSLAVQADDQPKIFNKPVIIPQFPTIPSHKVQIVGQDKATWSPYATQTFDLPIESTDSDSDVDETDTSVAFQAGQVQPPGHDKISWSPFPITKDEPNVDIGQMPVIVPPFATFPSNIGEVLGQDKRTWSPYPNNEPYDEFFGRPDLHVLKDQPPIKIWKGPLIVPQFPTIPSNNVLGQDKRTWSPYLLQTRDVPVANGLDSKEDASISSLALQAK